MGLDAVCKKQNENIPLTCSQMSTTVNMQIYEILLLQWLKGRFTKQRGCRNRWNCVTMGRVELR